MKTKMIRAAIAAICIAAALPSLAAELSGGAIVTRMPLRNAPAVFAEKGAGTVAFLGGSITEANGFRPLVETSLTNRFPTAQLSFTRAGLSSTCSTAGAFRFGDDVLARGVPDALFVEFAVNDQENPDHPYEVCLRGMEGIVRQARRANPKMDIVMVLFMTEDMLETVRAGNLPVPYAAHLAVAERYGIPTVNIAKALVNAEAAGTFTWTDYGANCHPNADGSQFISEVIDVLLDAEGWGTSVGTPAPYDMPERLDAGCYEYAHWIPASRVSLGDGWHYSVPDWSALTASCRANYKNDAVLWATTPGSVATVDFNGTDFGAFVLAGNDAGVLEISIDGDAFTSHALYDAKYSKTLQLPYARVFRSGLLNGPHTATLRVTRYGTNGNVGGTAVRLFRIGANGIAHSANVEWEAPCDVTGDSDIDTTGAFRYAYGNSPNVTPYNFSTATVNGVTFFVGSRAANDWRGADLKFQSFDSSQWDNNLAWAGGIDAEGNISAHYRTMLGCGLYSTVSPYAASITFRRLVPGRRYLIQLWCSRGSAAAAGETITVDDAVTLSTSGSASGAGQYVKGTFTANATAQTITLKGNNGVVCFNMVQLRDISPLPTIAWEDPKNITGDADVRTDGALRCAYACSAVTINGVPFKSGINTQGIPDGNAALIDIGLEVFSSYRNDTTFASSVPSGASSGYLQLLKSSCFTPNGTVNTGKPGWLTLKHLIPGHTYLVQIWVNDKRSVPGDHRWFCPDGDNTKKVKYRTSSGFGQHVSGTFTAAAEEHRFSLVGWEDGTTLPSAQFNSIQLRDITPGCVTWETPVTISADTDVRTDGNLVYAWSFAASDATANGVTFQAQKTVSERLGDSVRLAGVASVNTTVFSGSGASGNISANYRTILRGGGYNDAKNLEVTLGSLVPGGRYLVQLWFNESRNDGPDRYMLPDGSAASRARMRANSSFGQHVTGTFTADSTKNDIIIVSQHVTSTANPFGATQLTALQVRRLGAGTGIEWRRDPITKSVTDVRADGTLLYALNFGNVATTINGTVFAAQTKGNIDTANIACDLTGENDTAFAITDSETPSAYLTMLKSSCYISQSSITLTLKRLTPGHRYLVQLWVHDGRDLPGFDRILTIDDTLTLNFRNKDAYDPARGDYATGIFTAKAETQAIKLSMGSRTGVAPTVQLNGMQVRDLGAPNDCAYRVWAGGASDAWGADATNWNDLDGNPLSGTLWNAENGATNIAFFTTAATALPSQDITVGGIIANDALTVGAADDGCTVNVVGAVEAPSCTFKSGWAADALMKSDSGSFTLEGASPYLAKVVAGGGSLTLSRTDALKTGADVSIAEGATLTLAEGATPVISRFEGEGTITFNGTVEVTNTTVQSFTGTFDGYVTVRKTGPADYTLGGSCTATHGPLVLEARVGTTFLVTDGAVVDVAEGAVVNLAGARRLLGSVAGKGTLAHGTVSLLEVLDGSDITLDAVMFLNGVWLDGVSSVGFAGDADVEGLSVHVADPAAVQAAHRTVISATGTLTGEPVFTFGASGYKAKLTDDRKGYVIWRPGLMLVVR